MSHRAHIIPTHAQHAQQAHSQSQQTRQDVIHVCQESSLQVGALAEWNFWLRNLNWTSLNFLKPSSQVNNFTVFFHFFIGKSVFSKLQFHIAIPRPNKFGLEN